MHQKKKTKSTKNIFFITSITFNLILLIVIGNHLNYDYTKLFKTEKKLYNVETDSVYIKTRTARTSLLATLPNRKGDIIFLGNSLIENFPLQEMFGNLNIKNRGVNGNTSKDILRRMSIITSAKPSKVFLMTGINDIYRNNENVNSAFQNIVKICDIIRLQTPETKIHVHSILPIDSEGDINSKIIRLNSLILDYCKSNSFHYIDLHSKFIQNNKINPIYTTDGVHLTDKGYLLWKKSIDNYVNE